MLSFSQLPDGVKVNILSYLSPLYWADIVECARYSPIAHIIQHYLFPSFSKHFYIHYFEQLKNDWYDFANYAISHGIHNYFQSFTAFMAHLLDVTDNFFILQRQKRVPYVRFTTIAHDFLNEKQYSILEEELEGWIGVTSRSFFLIMNK
jgi:hypothetical protein